MTVSTPGRLARTLGLCATLAFTYVVLGRLTFAVSVEHGNVTSVVFASEGVALAFCILFGPRVAPGIFLGQTILSLWSGPSLLGGAVIGLINSFEGVLGWWLFHRWGISRHFDRPRDVALFLVMIFLVLQPISATGGTMVLYLLGAVPADLIPADWAPWWIQGMQKPLPSFDLVPSAWVHWWIGNSVGQLLAAPLVLAWSTRATPGMPVGRFDFLLSAGGIALILLLTLSGIPTHPLLLLPVTYALLVWIGLRRGLRGITLANLLIGAAVTWAGAEGGGFLSHLSMADRLSNVGLFVAAAACSLSLMLFAMFEERRILIERLTELASWDPLVQLSNRRHFTETATREIARARRNGTAIAFLMLDVDDFKQVNDQHGHAAGDIALKAIARCCASLARESDLVGRLGGEEFALLLVDASLDRASQLAERLRAMIADQPVQVDDHLCLSLTVSIGVAPLGDLLSLDAMMSAADRALYLAKRTGRNRVSFAQ